MLIIRGTSQQYEPVLWITCFSLGLLKAAQLLQNTYY